VESARRAVSTTFPEDGSSEVNGAGVSFGKGLGIVMALVPAEPEMLAVTAPEGASLGDDRGELVPRRHVDEGTGLVDDVPSEAFQ
jgi:hypothetical protein